MIDFGFDKIALIGAVALIVIGPEKLPRVARTVGHLVGKAQRYVADVKAEVNRSIELEELRKMKTEFEDAAHDAGRSVSDHLHQTGADLRSTWDDGVADAALPPHSGDHVGWTPAPPQYRNPGKNWRVKRASTPQWFKQRSGVRVHALSGAARVARFRPLRAAVRGSAARVSS